MKKPPRGFRMRWAGMALVALAVVIGTPVALSFANVLMLCPRSFELRSRPIGDWRQLKSGVISRHFFRGSDRLPSPRSPWRFVWVVEPYYTDVQVPVWPIPIGLGVMGAFMYVRGTARTDRATRRSRAWRERLAGATAAVGLSAASLVALSFLSQGGVQLGVSRDPWLPNLNRFERGTIVIHRVGAGELADLIWRVEPASPLSVRWDASGGWVPVWPLPIALLGLGTLALWRNERALLRACRGGCPSCGYPIDTVPGGVCPECGE